MKKTHCKICISSACVDRCILFDHLSDEEIDMLSPGKEIAFFRKKERLPDTGFSTAHIVYVCAGHAKVYINSPYKKKFLLEIVGRERFIANSFSDFGHSLTTVVALTGLKICYFSIQEFMKVAENNATFAVALLKHFNRNDSIRFNRLTSIAIKQSRGKLADALLYLDKNFTDIDIYELITRKDLSDIANISTENAIRTLRDFVSEGIIKIDNRVIEIINMPGLEKISQKG